MFDALGLVTSGDPYAMTQAEQDAAARNPRWVPAISSATSASIGAHVGTHAAAEAARVVFRFGLWPAALELWGIAGRPIRAPGNGRTARWQDGKLILPGLPPLALADVAAKAHARNGVTGAMAHGFSRWAWSQRDVRGRRARTGRPNRRACGALRRPASSRASIAPRRAFRRPSTTASARPTRRSAARLVRVEIERATGSAAHRQGLQRRRMRRRRWFRKSWSGRRRAASRWASATRCSKQLPPFEDGPGNGKWNLGEYVIARGSDLPLHDLEIEMLPPVAPNDRRRAWRKS